MSHDELYRVQSISCPDAITHFVTPSSWEWQFLNRHYKVSHLFKKGGKNQN